MSRYTMYYVSKQQQYRDLALSWSEIVKTLNLNETQRKGMAIFFKAIAKRFGLVQEFKNLGIL